MRGDPLTFRIRWVRKPPAREPVSAVFLLAIKGDTILAVRNERGWDIPGGHVEPGESYPGALARELMPPDAFLRLCSGPAELLATLINRARLRLNGLL